MATFVPWVSSLLGCGYLEMQREIQMQESYFIHWLYNLLSIDPAIMTWISQFAKTLDFQFIKKSIF